MEEQLRSALIDAMGREFAHIPEADDLDDSYAFSAGFEEGVERIFKIASKPYVSVGRHRIRRAVAAALIAAMIMAAAAGAAALRRPIVRWFTHVNKAEGALDVSFEVEDSDGLTGQFTCIRPDVPKGYKVIHEDQVQGLQYSVIYQNKEGLEISYLQTGDMQSMGLGLDNETGDLQETKVNGYKGYSYSSSGNNTLIWSNGIYLFSLGGTCSMDVIRSIAEKIN